MLMERLAISCKIHLIGKKTLLIMAVHYNILIIIDRVSCKIGLTYSTILIIIISIITVYFSYIVANLLEYICPNICGKYVFIKQK